jgi:arabinose-5-phosphate isomerase
MEKIQNTLLEMKNEANHQLNNMPLEEICKLSIKLVNTNNNIYFTGVGKSENIAFHTSSILKSIGLKAYNLNCQNCLHGDIGSLEKDDIVLLFSNSGNTKELIELIEFLKQRKCINIGICCNLKSKFKDLCNSTIVLPFKNELKINDIHSIPTNSYMVQLFFCNILTSQIVNYKNIYNKDYKLNHPAGNIGKNLKTIKDILITNYPKINISGIQKIRINDILLEMTKYSIGCCFFINNEELYGILTDGDIRRLLLNDTKDIININNINTNYDFESNILKLTKNVENIKKKKFVPVIENNKFIGIISYRDILY